MNRDGWRNRIVGEGQEAPDQLLFNDKNWRIHPRSQRDALAGVLSEVGWVQRIIVNRRSGMVVDGHLRVDMALERGEPSVPVLYIDLSEEEERLVLATLDPLSALAVADSEKLGELLREVKAQDGAVQEMLAGLAKENKLEFGPPDEREDHPEVISRADELQKKWRVQRGQIWRMGGEVRCPKCGRMHKI